MKSQTYARFSKIVVVVNVIALAGFYSGQSSASYNFLCVLNQLCFLVSVTQYITEVVIFGKRRPSLYFDLICLIIAVPGVYLTYIPMWKINSQRYQTIREVLLFFRAAQIIRCYKVLDCFSAARSFLSGILKILPKVTSLLAFFFMILFISAIIAEDLFGRIKYNGSLTP
jgi:hypothetical protein